MVRRVELHGGLGGSHFHNPAALGLNQTSCHLHRFAFTQDVIVVIAVHFRLQLLDAIPDASRLIKIHERSFERQNFPCGYQISVGRSVTFGGYPQYIIQATPAAAPEAIMAVV
jgi:hypothetical protein